ncbi:unnamed protein product [Oikopleura dioica]|uniref:Reverse transcriptase domain-containing protein n=1 Tax=Oikopleura dioica TaxID=34765 RepID=E4XW06_OIKDI|nr:unnamed protein product [Oikopleura dioica]
MARRKGGRERLTPVPELHQEQGKGGLNRYTEKGNTIEWVSSPSNLHLNPPIEFQRSASESFQSGEDLVEPSFNLTSDSSVLNSSDSNPEKIVNSRRMKKRRLAEMVESDQESSEQLSTRDGQLSPVATAPSKRTRRLRSYSSAERSDSSTTQSSRRRASFSYDDNSSRPSNSDVFTDTDTDSLTVGSIPSEDLMNAAVQLIDTAKKLHGRNSTSEGIELIKGAIFHNDVNQKILELEEPGTPGARLNLEEIQRFLQTNVVAQTAGMRADRFTLIGRGICIAADKVKDLLSLLGPGSTREELINNPPGGPNVVLPETMRQLRIAISLGTLRRNKIRNHFKSRTVSISREFRQNWYSMCVNKTQEMVDGLGIILENRPSDDELISQGLVDPSQYEKLAELRDTLLAFLNVKGNKKALLEIFGSGRTIIFCFLPAPGHDSIYHYIRSYILRDSAPIPMERMVINANQICRLIMEDAGLTFITTNTHRAVIGTNYRENNSLCFNVEQRMILSVSPSPTKIDSRCKYSLNLYRFSLRALIVKKYKISPDSIDFNNIDNLKLSHNELYMELVNLYAKITMNPIELNQIIDNDQALGDQPTIIRSKQNPSRSTRRNNGRDEMLKNLIRNGTVPTQPLPTNIPCPDLFVSNAVDQQLSTQILARWRSRRVDVETRNPQRQDYQRRSEGSPETTDRPKQTVRNLNAQINSYTSLSPDNINKISALENPSNSEVNELKALCKELNELNKKQAVDIRCINTNPGLCDLKGEKFRDIVNEHKKVDLVFTNELRMDREFFDQSECWPEGFHCVTHDKLRSSNLAYSAIMLRNSTMADYVREKCSFGTITGLLLENHNNQKLCVFSIYRPIPKPDCKSCFYKQEGNVDPLIFVEWIKQARDFARKHNAGVIIAGDYNTAFDRDNDDEGMTAALLDALKGLVDLCIDPTFFRKNCQPSTIDHVHVSDPRKTNLKNLRLHKTLMFDGHCGQSFRFNFGVARCSYKVVSSRILGSPDRIKEKALAYFNRMLKDLKRASSPEAKIRKSFSWTKKIMTICSKHVVKIELDKNEFEIVKGRDTIHYEEMKKVVTKWKQDQAAERGHEVFTLLSKLGVMIKKLKLRDKRAARIKLSDKAEGDKNIIWDVFNHECRPNALWNVDKEYTPEQLADKVQELQESTASNVILDEPMITTAPTHKLEFFPYSVNGENHYPSILQKFNNLKSHTKGYSGVNKRFLDLLPVAFMEPLIIDPVRTCLDSGLYPDVLRNSRVVILPKKAKGIRPLAISEAINSVLEKVIIGSLNNFIEGTKSLPDQQSGFRSSMSCGTAMFEILKAYEEDMQKGKVLAVVLLDAKNAFGSLSHQNLMVLLKRYFQGRALKLLENSLARSFVVNANGFYSSLRKGTPHGVPQGGSLSPSLFCLFISQIANLPCLDAEKRILLFADDTALVVGARNYTDLMEKTNTALELLEDALTSLGLMLVPSKTNILTFGKSKYLNHGMKCEFRMKDTVVNPVSKAKYLGSWIEARKGQLTFDFNTKILQGKMKGINNKASCIVHSLSLDTNATIMRACAMGALQHNLAVLPPLSNANVAKMQRTYDIGLEIGNNRRVRKAIGSHGSLSRTKRFGLSQGSYARITNKLTKASQPSINCTTIRTIMCNIQSVFRTGKSESQCEFLCRNISLNIAGTDSNISRGIPHLRSMHTKMERRKRLIDINSEINCETIDESHLNSLYSEIVMLELIENEFLDFKIDPALSFPTQGAKNRLWPLFACDWIAELPIKVRKQILQAKGKNKIKEFYKKMHVHLEQSVYCIQCRPSIENVTIKILDRHELAMLLLICDKKFYETLRELKYHPRPNLSSEFLDRWLISNNLDLANMCKFLLKTISNQ